MKPITEFIGINNVVAPARHKPGELTVALNIDLDATRALVTRRGHVRIKAGQAHSIWRAPFGLLGVVDMDLGLLSDDGLSFVPLYFALGCDDRVWYTLLPTGWVAFSNGYITGLTDGAVARTWGVPTPTARGDSVVGDTPYWLTYIRHSDGIESAPLYCPPTLVGAPLSGLPVRDGHDIGVYYALDGLTGFYAGRTSGNEFTYVGQREQVVNPCRTEHLLPMPAGRCLDFWNSRALVAVDRVLWATEPFKYEQRDSRGGFLQFPDPITFVFGVDAGIWLGTTTELLFLRGAAFRELRQENVRSGLVVLGSGAAADFTLMAADARPGGSLSGAFCISNGEIVGCGSNGASAPYTAGRYKTAATEVFSTTRVRDGVLQYIASERQ